MSLVARSEDGTRRKVCVTADIMGSLAVHQAVLDKADYQWAITHRPTGIRVTYAEEYDDARRIVERLYRTAVLALGKRTAAAILDAMPADVYRWLKRCDDLWQYVEARRC